MDHLRGNLHQSYEFLMRFNFREWSLITGSGGLQNGRVGHVKFYPYEKGGDGQRFWGIFYTVA